MKIYFLFLSLFPLALYSQSIQENLDYINAQFEKYNKYETSFEVDEDSKTLTCHDKFGTFIVFLEDVDFKMEPNGKNIGIFCLDQSVQCISTLQEDGFEGATFSKYTMDLLENGDGIPHLNEVLKKFVALKEMVLENNTVAYSSQVQRLKYRIDILLQELNAIYEKQTVSQKNWSFDWDNYWLVCELDSCKTLIPLESVDIEYHEKENVQSFRHGVIFQSGEFEISKKCKSSEEKLQTASFQFDELDHANAAIENLSTIQLLISDGPEYIDPNESAISTDQLLTYLNSQFKKYNQYNTRFFVDSEKQELIWIQDFGETRVSLDQIDVKADVDNAWLVIYCKEKSNRCINSSNGAGKSFQSTEYSMSLKENDTIIDHIDEVIKKMKALISSATKS